jgi:hypothetical protein
VNTGPSGVCAPVDGIVVDVALIDAGHTLYGRIGNLLPWACVLLTIGGWVIGRRAHRAKRKKK